MIVSRISGGLGNQMFQYAFGLYQAQRNHTELVLDCSALTQDPSRTYVLDRWKLEARVASDDQRQLFPRRYGGRGWSNVWRGRVPLRFVRERPFGFQAKYLSCGGGVYLDGYWQSERYFPNLREQLQSQFQPSDSQGISKESIAIARRMEQGPSVSLHVRRGDYVQNPITLKIHGVCTSGYYRACVEALLERFEKLHLYVFSDDHPWCKQHLRYSCPMTHVDHNGPAEAHEDLWLMTRCRHHIVANSTFSWWGAWLRVDESGTVYAPERWFLDARFNSRSIVPATWKKMSATESSQQQAA